MFDYVKIKDFDAYKENIKKDIDIKTAATQHAITAYFKTMMDHISILTETINERLQIIEERESKYKPDDEPWFDYKEVYNNDNNQAEVIMDWNDLFIQKLKKLGFPGTDEMDVVKNYLNYRMQEMYNDNKESFK